MGFISCSELLNLSRLFVQYVRENNLLVSSLNINKNARRIYRKHMPLQKGIWSVIQVASTLYPPHSVANIFESWLHGVHHRFKKHTRIRAIAILWSVYLCK
jgi:hypothetical protein